MFARLSAWTESTQSSSRHLWVKPLRVLKDGLDTEHVVACTIHCILTNTETSWNRSAVGDVIIFRIQNFMNKNSKQLPCWCTRRS